MHCTPKELGFARVKAAKKLKVASLDVFAWANGFIKLKSMLWLVKTRMANSTPKCNSRHYDSLTGTSTLQRAIRARVARLESIRPTAFTSAAGMTVGQGLRVGATITVVVGLINEAAFGDLFVGLFVLVFAFIE